MNVMSFLFQAISSNSSQLSPAPSLHLHLAVLCCAVPQHPIDFNFNNTTERKGPTGIRCDNDNATAVLVVERATKCNAVRRRF